MKKNKMIKGSKQTYVVKQQISQTMKEKVLSGEINPVFSDKARLNCKRVCVGRVPWNKGKKMSDEQKKKLSLAKIGNSNAKGSVRSEVYKQKQRSNKLGLKHTEESKLKMSKAQKGKVLSEEHCKKISEAKKGINTTEHNAEWCEKVSKGVSKAYLEGRVPGKIINFKGNKMKSTWEVAFAKWCDSKKIAWKYQPFIFTYRSSISNKLKRYIVDFLLIKSGEFVEVKGWLNDRSIEHMDAFVDAGHKLYLVDSPDNIRLSKEALWQMSKKIVPLGGG